MCPDPDNATCPNTASAAAASHPPPEEQLPRRVSDDPCACCGANDTSGRWVTAPPPTGGHKGAPGHICIKCYNQLWRLKKEFAKQQLPPDEGALIWADTPGGCTGTEAVPRYHAKQAAHIVDPCAGADDGKQAAGRGGGRRRNGGGRGC